MPHRTQVLPPEVAAQTAILEKLERAERTIRAAEAARLSAIWEALDLAGLQDEAGRAAASSAAGPELAYRAMRAEIAAVLHMSEHAVDKQFNLAWQLTEVYRQIGDAHRDGLISNHHTQVIVDAGAVIGSGDSADAIGRRVAYEEAVLPYALVETPNRLRPIAKRLAERYAESSIDERHTEARQQRRVWVTARDDGMSDLTASLPAVEARAIYEQLTVRARRIEHAEARAHAQAQELAKAQSLRAQSFSAPESRARGSKVQGSKAQGSSGQHGAVEAHAGCGAGDDVDFVRRSRDEIRADLLSRTLLGETPAVQEGTTAATSGMTPTKPGNVSPGWGPVFSTPAALGTATVRHAGAELLTGTGASIPGDLDGVTGDSRGENARLVSARIQIIIPVHTIAQAIPEDELAKHPEFSAGAAPGEHRPGADGTNDTSPPDSAAAGTPDAADTPASAPPDARQKSAPLCARPSPAPADTRPDPAPAISAAPPEQRENSASQRVDHRSTPTPPSDPDPFAGLSLFDEHPDAPELAGYGPIDTDTACMLAGSAAVWETVRVDAETGVTLSVDRYRPSEAMKRFLIARDQHCRFPGCTTPAQRCDIDHTIDAQHGGPTSTNNLAHLCRRHHTLKHHTGWTVEQQPRGVLEWISPAGRRYVDRPLAQIPRPTQREVRFVAG